MRYGFKLLTFHADQDAKGFRLSISRDETRATSTFSKAHSAAASGHCVEFVDVAKIYVNGVIVFCVEISFRMCVSDFCLEKRQILHEDKIVNPQ